jgi:hypothetical protein
MPTTDPTHAELYVRADTFGTHDLQTDVRRRLARLDDDGALDDVDVSTWGSRVRLDTPATGDEARAIERFRSFVHWAERAGVSLEPFFETWTRRSEVLDEEYEELVTPVMCVALYDEDEVIDVAPHRVGDETRTVSDCLDDLEAACEADEVRSGRDRGESNDGIGLTAD